jgi:hypothetical protein
VQPLLHGDDPPAYRFGKARPSLLPFLAAFGIGGSVGADIPYRLELSSSRAGLAISAERRYAALHWLFRHLERPSEETANSLAQAIMEVLQPLRARALGGDAARLARIYGALELGKFAYAAPARDSHLRSQRGAQACSVEGLMVSLGKDNSPRTAAQIVTACRRHDRDIMGGKANPLPERLRAAVFEDFHSPLGEALAAALPGEDDARRLAEALWSRWQIKPHDLRPSRFARDCANERQRKERYKTLAALADRSNIADELLSVAGAAAPLDPDLARVTEAMTRWRAAFGLQRPR